MGPRSCALYSYEDPWRASAFFLALTQLLLSVLVLVRTIIICVTCQLMKWYGWEYSSCRDSVYQQERFDSCAIKKPVNVDLNANTGSLLISTEKFLKRTQSEGSRALKSRSLFCTKCHGAWNLKQGLSFRYDKGATFQMSETPTPSDAGNSPLERFLPVEAGVSSSACGSKTSAFDKLACCRDSCFEPSDCTEKSLSSDREKKIRDGVVEAGHGILHLETLNLNEGNDDTPGNCLNTPVCGFPRLVKEVSIEGSILKETQVEDACSSSNERRGNGRCKVSIKSAGSEVNFESSELTPRLQKELHDETADEDLCEILRMEDDSKKCGFEGVIKGLQDEQISAVKDDRKDYDIESLIKGLKDAVLKEQKKLCALYAELEVERISSETAANEAMAMISRLQEQKAALRMQAAHYRRIAEEKAMYDEQAMQLLKDILIKKEKENFLLEKEVKAMRTRFYRDLRKCGKRRQGVYRRSLSAEGQGMLLLKNEEEVDGVHVLYRNGEGSVGKSPFFSQSTEEQPPKRLKGIADHKDVMSQSIGIASATSQLKSNTHLALSGVSKMASHLDPDCSYEGEHSVFATISNECSGVCDKGLDIQEVAKVPEGKLLPSQCEKLMDAAEDKDKSSEGLLMVPNTLYSTADLMQESSPYVSDNREKQDFLAQVIPDDIVEKANAVNQSGEKKKREAVFVDNTVLDTFALSLSDEVGSRVAACVEETRDLASHILQFPSMVVECNTVKDLQARVQIIQVDKLPQSCPSSLNHKGSGFNHFEEILNI